MSRSYKKVPSSSWDNNNSGRRKSFRRPNMRHAAKAYRRKYGKLHNWGRKSIFWEWEYQSVEHLLVTLESHERAFKNTNGMICKTCGSDQCFLWRAYEYWLGERHATDTQENRRAFAEKEIRQIINK